MGDVRTDNKSHRKIKVEYQDKIANLVANINEYKAWPKRKIVNTSEVHHDFMKRMRSESRRHREAWDK